MADGASLVLKGSVQVGAHLGKDNGAAPLSSPVYFWRSAVGFGLRSPLFVASHLDSSPHGEDLAFSLVALPLGEGEVLGRAVDVFVTHYNLKLLNLDAGGGQVLTQRVTEGMAATGRGGRASSLRIASKDAIDLHSAKSLTAGRRE